ncbi:InlB B-repeat-containing protein [Candidatus Saccharibacteria bacterium]|nr:InlB B-repeat-containing protein [Candidatus Saccharibacteria bacterium]
MPKFLKNKTMIVVMSFLFASFIFSTPVFAYSASMTTSGAVTINAQPKGDGSVGTSINSEEINITTNCRAGYNLTISGPSDRNLYRDGDSSNNTQGQYFAPIDGTSALKNTSNAWGYSLTANNEDGIFTPLSDTPAFLKTTAQTASQTDINDSFSIYYGVSVSNTLNPGYYSMSSNNAIVYQLTIDESCSGYTVEYNANGGTGTMSNQDITMDSATKLSANSFTAPEFGQSYEDADGSTIPASANKLWTFWGWNTEVDGTGDWYKDKEQVINLANDGDGIVLYAQWKQATMSDLVAATPSATQKVIDHNTMQDMSPETCWNSDITTAANAPAAVLLDYRGKITTGENAEAPEQYTVSKLADNNCWMTTNLNLGRESGGPNGDGTITLTPDDTDLSSGNYTFTLPANTNASSTSNLARIHTTNNSGDNSNGTYYSFAAAMAYQGQQIVTGGQSICPKNWDLPVPIQYYILNNKMSYSSTNQTTSSPSSFLINGGFANGSSFYQTSYGYYWTNNYYPSSSSNQKAYGVRINNNSISLSSSTGTTYGADDYYEKNIRCVASKGNLNINFDGNGSVEYPVTGTTQPQFVTDVGYSQVLSNSFVRDGWKFNSWNTKADGSGIKLEPMSNDNYTSGPTFFNIDFRPGETITLYAQWTPLYTITYVNNCMNYNSSDTNCTQSTSDTTRVQTISLNSTTGNGSATLYNKNAWTTLTNWKIAGWNTSADGSGTEYQSGTRYSVTNQNAGDGIVLYAHWVPVYTLQYDGNGADAGVMTNVKHTNVIEGDVFDLFASNYSKANYGFAGWSFDANAQPGGASRIYGPNEAITAPASSNPGETKTLYAVWVPAETGVYMQTWNGCGSLASGAVIALKDQRDNNVYTVGKLADGNCWMMENLRIDAAATNGSTNLGLQQGYAGAFTGLADSETANFSNSTTANTYNNETKYSTSNITDSNQGYRFPRYNNSNTASRNSSPSATDNRNTTNSTHNNSLGSAIYSYGNYYTWAAALANTNDYTGPTATVDGKTSETANTSICPSGWQLPYGRSTGNGATSGGFYNLGVALNAAASTEASSRIWRSYPNNYVYSGYYGSSSASSRGSTIYLWTSTAVDYTSAYYASLSYSSVSAGNSPLNKFRGGSVRCVKINN